MIWQGVVFHINPEMEVWLIKQEKYPENEENVALLYYYDG